MVSLAWKAPKKEQNLHFRFDFTLWSSFSLCFPKSSLNSGTGFPGGTRCVNNRFPVFQYNSIHFNTLYSFENRSVCRSFIGKFSKKRRESSPENPQAFLSFSRARSLSQKIFWSQKTFLVQSSPAQFRL